MKRTLIEINEDKCIGCGLCAGACEQGAIQMIDGKAKLVSDTYCDGLGKCLPACPVDAIKLTEKEAEAFDQSRKGFALSEGCGSSKEKVLKPDSSKNPFSMADALPNFKPNEKLKPSESNESVPSELRQWPVQLSLVNVNAPFFDNCNLLIAADCTAYAYGNFHQEFMQNKVTLIGCPKLDNMDEYIEKLTAIFNNHTINSVTVLRMSVPCCGGITTGVKKAIENANRPVPYLERTISAEGKLL